MGGGQTGREEKTEKKRSAGKYLPQSLKSFSESADVTRPLGQTPSLPVVNTQESFSVHFTCRVTNSELNSSLRFDHGYCKNWLETRFPIFPPVAT